MDSKRLASLGLIFYVMRLHTCLSFGIGGLVVFGGGLWWVVAVHYLVVWCGREGRSHRIPIFCISEFAVSLERDGGHNNYTNYKIHISSQPIIIMFEVVKDLLALSPEKKELHYPQLDFLLT